MIHSFTKLVFLFFIVYSTTGCALLKQKSWLKEHQSHLEDTVASEDPELMLEGLASSLVGVMDQGLTFVNPKEGAEYIKKYSDRNKGSIDQIIGEVENWMQGMDPLEKAAVALGMFRKPVFRDLVQLAPKFKKKYKQLSFISKTLGKLTKVFGKLG